MQTLKIKVQTEYYGTHLFFYLFHFWESHILNGLGPWHQIDNEETVIRQLILYSLKKKLIQKIRSRACQSRAVQNM